MREFSMKLDPKFLEFLTGNPELLKSFYEVIKKWNEHKSKDIPLKTEEGPRQWKAGEKVELTTSGLSDEYVADLTKGMAEAVAKEKFAEYVKGFISGVTF